MPSVAIVGGHPLLRSGLRRVVEVRLGWQIVWVGDDLPQFMRSSTSATMLVLDSESTGHATSLGSVGEIAARGIRVVILCSAPISKAADKYVHAGVAAFLSKSDSEDSVVASLQRVETDAQLREAPLQDLEFVALSSSPSLSARQLEVLQLYAQGLTIGSIARRLTLSEHTVKYYLRMVRKKFQERGLRSTTQLDLARSAEQVGLVNW